MPDSPFLMVSGFHRSGTSLVAQTLHANGVDMGHDLMGASFANPLGHFEDMPLVSLHDKLLSVNGLNWQHTQDTPIAVPRFLSPAFTNYSELRQAQKSAQFYGAKDPRALSFLNNWSSAFSNNVLFLLVFRGWKYSVSSLLKRHSRMLLNTVSSMASRPEDVVFWEKPDLAAKMWASSAKLCLAHYESNKAQTLLFPLDDFLAKSDTFNQHCQRVGLPLTLFNTESSFSADLLQASIPESAFDMLSDATRRECDALEDKLYQAFGSAKLKQHVQLKPSHPLTESIQKEHASRAFPTNVTIAKSISLSDLTIDEVAELLPALPTDKKGLVKWEELINRDGLDNADLQKIFDMAMRHKQLDIAEIAMQRAIAKHNAPFRWMNLGDVYLQKKLFELAKRCYKTAKEMAPQNATFIARLADIETLNGDYNEAERLIQEAIQLDSTKPAINIAKRRLEETKAKAGSSSRVIPGVLPLVEDYQQVVAEMTNNVEKGLALDSYTVKSAFVTRNSYEWLYTGLSMLSSTAQRCLLDYMLTHLSKYWDEIVLETELLPSSLSTLPSVHYLNRIKHDNNAPIGVHIHAYYPKLLPELLSFIANIPSPIKLVCTCLAQDKAVIENMLPEGAIVITCENRGRDIAPWLLYAAKHLESCKVALKLHTKSSSHESALYGWRLQLLWCLLGNESTVENVLQRFESAQDLTIIGAAYHRAIKDDIHWGENKRIAEDLSGKLNVNTPENLEHFPAGSMFWYKPASLLWITNYDWSIDDFPLEEGQIDGTVMHAIERILGIFGLHIYHPYS
ncbi:rhamnan synthesis F family protein [Alteromonas gracilis]|uniref:rhamnan synthesis F family protein n=1 Tax=Alteromonas gracilis TaxID=1479524 RepID=UPI002FE0612F